MKASGLAGGYPGGAFRPGSSITRDAVTAFLYRVLGSPQGDDPPCVTVTFEDVQSTNVFCASIALLHGLSVVRGAKVERFDASGAVSRQAMTAFLHRLAHLDEPPIFRGDWTDAVAQVIPSDDSSLVDVACPATDWCLAVGGRDQSQVPPYFTPVIVEWDGDQWTETPGPPTGLGLRPASVACWAVDGCAITAERFDTDGARNVAWIWDGEGHDHPVTMDVATPSTRADRAEIGCQPDGPCVLVDDNSGQHAIWDGGAWSVASGLARTPVACALDGCLAATGKGTTWWDGQDWHDRPGFAGRLPFYEPWGLDCTSWESCLSVGYTSSTRPGAPAPIATRWDGGAWAHEPVPLLSYGVSETISCASGHECLALVAETHATPQVADTSALAWNGERWYPPAEPPGDDDHHYLAVDCAPGSCLAVGWRLDGTDIRPISARYTWSD
jgi:hypothetical protein